MIPKISVCMPTYNSEKYLREAIESVLMQDYADFEFIIVDDCSKDRSADIIAAYAKNDGRIAARFNERNIGMVNNWNRCMTYARGEYIKFLFGDDKLDSQSALGEMAALLDSNDDVSLVAASRYVIDEASRKLKVLSAFGGTAPYNGADIIMDCIVEQKNKIGEPSAVMFRKKNGKRGFDPRYRQIVDLEMWFHILEQGKFGYIPEPLVSFRIHPLQQTRQNTLNPDLGDEPFLLLQEYSRKPYIKLPCAKKEYMLYLPAYSIWKLYKQHKKISRQTAIEMIKRRYPLLKFVLLYPFFKAYKLYMSAVTKHARVNYDLPHF
jgi:glycosyltransferase involved in cell wall biosynthesis